MPCTRAARLLLVVDMPVADPALTAPPEVGTQGTAPKLDEVLDDLAMRFVVNCPAEEQESFESCSSRSRRPSGSTRTSTARFGRTRSRRSPF